MSKLRIISSASMCRLLESIGFVIIRQKGSHRFFRNADGRSTIIPVHAGDLDRSLIRKILKDIGLSIDEYNDKF